MNIATLIVAAAAILYNDVPCAANCHPPGAVYSPCATASLAVAAPPCGTPEALKVRVCIVWKVVPCPPPWHNWYGPQPPKNDHAPIIDSGAFYETMPIGCPLNGQVYP